MTIAQTAEFVADCLRFIAVPSGILELYPPERRRAIEVFIDAKSTRVYKVSLPWAVGSLVASILAIGAIPILFPIFLVYLIVINIVGIIFRKDVFGWGCTILSAIVGIIGSIGSLWFLKLIGVHVGPFLEQGHLLQSILLIPDAYCRIDHLCAYFSPSFVGGIYFAFRDFIQQYGHNGGQLVVFLVDIFLFYCDIFVIIIAIVAAVSSVILLILIVICLLSFVVIGFFRFSSYMKDYFESQSNRIPVGAGIIFLLGETLHFAVSIAKFMSPTEAE